MKHTWLVEHEIPGHGLIILGYFHRLRDAQHYLLKDSGALPDLSILKLRGPFFGEGFHEYRMTRVNGRWVKEKP